MSFQPTVVDTVLSPGRVLSARQPRDYLLVAYWALWAPRMFEEYSRYLWQVRGEGVPPSTLDVVDTDRWLAANPGQNEFFKITIVVWIAVVLCMLGMDAICIVPVLPEAADAAWYRFWWFMLVILVVSLVIPLASWLTIGREGNIGALYTLTLQSEVAINVTMLLTIWWWPLQAHYLPTSSLTTSVVFMVGGWGIGFVLNILLGWRRIEFDRLVKVLLICVVPILLALIYLQLASGIPISTKTLVWNDAQVHVLTIWLFWAVGFLVGLLRPLDWAVCTFLVNLPDLRSRQQVRPWWVPGTTLIPVAYLQRRLVKWLEYDWQRGIRIVSDLSRVSCQQRPLANAVREHLATTNNEQLPEKLAIVCDSGALCVPQIIRPPVAGYPKSDDQDRSFPVQVTATQQRYQQEVALADVLDHRREPTELRQRGPGDTLHAAYWYYRSGYLFAAGDIIQQYLTGNNAPATIITSLAFAEFRTLVLTLQALQDLPNISAQPTAVLPARPQASRRPQAWTFVDEFTTAARWIWRGRRSLGPAREACLSQFRRITTNIENEANASLLADRRLFSGTAQVWARQVVPLLNDTSGATTFVPVLLRPWESVYLELGSMCPWLQKSRELNREWRPGKTEIVFVASQPMAGARQAIEEAVRRSPIRSVLAVCDLARWEGMTIGLDEFCASLCGDIARALNATERLPDDAILGGTTSDGIRDLIRQLCEIDADRTVVLLVENIHLIQMVVSPGTERDRAIQFLGRMESEIHNLALAVQSTDRDDTWTRFKRQIAPTRACPEIIVPLLSEDGVQQWLFRQFNDFGPYFTTAAVREAYLLTGGHPILLASLSQSIAVDYNAQTMAAPIAPQIDAAEITAAANATLYQAQVQSFSVALARQLWHDVNRERRLLMYLLAWCNFWNNRPATADEIAGWSLGSTPSLSAPDIASTLETWVQYEVVTATEAANTTYYAFRSRSFARWVEQQRSVI